MYNLITNILAMRKLTIIENNGFSFERETPYSYTVASDKTNRSYYFDKSWGILRIYIEIIKIKLSE